MASQNYLAPRNLKVGHVHLKVSNVEKALEFYRDILGFQVTQRMGRHAVFLATNDYHHQLALNSWQSEGASGASKSGVGLFHVAFLYPTRKELAQITQRLFDHAYPLTGAADHGVSEAIYLDDPDGNGVELYWDKPQEEWPFRNGELEMYTKRLDIKGLLSLAR